MEPCDIREQVSESRRVELALIGRQSLKRPHTQRGKLGDRPRLAIVDDLDQAPTDHRLIGLAEFDLPLLGATGPAL